ncbi:MAG TPA: 4-(cytidine 5'-diphospho)-2-C-methyl-D-erythritol kinase, partial [Gemmatimonadales bacterium]
MTDTVVSLPALAKINLFLRVLTRDADGYHGLETLLCLVSLADTLQAERREGHGVTIEVLEADVGPPEQNLAVLATSRVLEATGNRFGIHLTLTKRIPARAGLGGGSSDAAAALHAANRLAGNAVPRHELLQFAAHLGSDIPFFFSGAPLALAWGRGERLLRLPPLPSSPALLLTPPVPIPTAEAYGWIDAAKQSTGRRGAVALDLDALSRWGDIGRMAGNDFESPVFSRYAEIRAAFEALVATRPLVCRMSGSGSTLFAIY